MANDVILLDESFCGSIVLFAVEREAKAFVRLFRNRSRHPTIHWCFTLASRGRKPPDDYPDSVAEIRGLTPPARQSEALPTIRWLCDGRYLVGLTGVGKHAARAAAEAILERVPHAKRLVVAGFAGALRSHFPLGEVVVAAEVVDESGNCWETTWPHERSGRVLTCDRMIGDPEQKRNLGEKHRADVVEMESSAVAEICQRRGVAFGCIRVVSDDVNQPLSQRLMGLVESGRVRIARVLWEMLRSPRMCIELIRLAKQTRFAADRLAERLRSALDASQ